MKKIVPLEGFMTATVADTLKSIDSEISEAQGFSLLTVDTNARRNDVQNNKTRIRLFNVVAVNDNADDKIKSYVGRKMYCVCMEKEELNNIIVDKDTGDKLFIIPLHDILAELVEQ